MDSQNSYNSSKFYDGLKKGMPIFLGYLPVSFTFGLIAVNGGLPPWFAVLISVTNLTSAGQFAGLQLILNGGSLIEIGITTFVINIRYMLMSLSLSQKINEKMPFRERSIIAHGITDEIFAVASLEKEEVGFTFMVGLMTMPILGWTLGTVLGAYTCNMLPKILQNAMGIALYAMFIALVVPASKKSKDIFIVTIIAICISTIFSFVSLFNFISGGWKLIIATIIASTIGAIVFPKSEGEM